MPDLLFTFTPPPAPEQPKPKPLHQRSEDELLDYLHGIEVRDGMHQEKRIREMTQRAVEEWERRRMMPWPGRIYDPPMQFHTMTRSSLASWDPRPEAVSTYNTITITIPAVADHDQALLLAERQIREQMGDSHLPQ